MKRTLEENAKDLVYGIELNADSEWYCATEAAEEMLKLIRSQTIEECAKVCEGIAEGLGNREDAPFREYAIGTIESCSENIRSIDNDKS